MTKARAIDLRSVCPLFAELTGEQRAAVRNCLGRIPTDELQGGYDALWADYEAGRVSCFAVMDAAGGIAAVSFFHIETLENGHRDFVSLASVVVEGTATHLTLDCIPQFEAIARALGCHSLSLRTCRPGLARQLVKNLGWFASEIVCRKTL